MPSAFPFPPFKFIIPWLITPSASKATRPPPPAPPASRRYLEPGSLASEPEASPPRTSINPRFSISSATIRTAPPEPAPPEKFAPIDGFTKTVPPFIATFTPDWMVALPSTINSMAPPPAPASPPFPRPPPDPPIKISSPPLP